MKKLATSTSRDSSGAGMPIYGVPAPCLVATASGGKLNEVVLRSKLKMKDSFVYLEVPDEMIDAFMQLIPKRGLVHPKDMIEKDEDKSYVGAHISVMYSDEYEDNVRKKKKRLVELGDEFEYTVDKMYSVAPESWGDVREVFFLTVNSPDLEALRKKYGLSKKLNGHEYHITVACIPRAKK